MLSISYASLSSRMAVPVPPPSWKPWRTLWELILALSQVSMIASTTFDRVSSKPIPRVLMFPFGMITIIVQPRSVGISPFCHMYCVRSTSFIHISEFGGMDVPSSVYSSLIHFLKCSALRCVWMPILFRRKRWTSTSTSFSVGKSSFILNGVA